MSVLVDDPYVAERLLAERRASGADRYDEVWEGIYMMTPIPNTEHQRIVGRLSSILSEIIDWRGLGEVCPGVNLTDEDIEDWTQDFRVPDVAVLLHEGRGKDCDTHWRGGIDFLIEVVSPGDRTREKVPFYSRLGVVELLVVDRDPWAIELYRRQDDRLQMVGRSTPEADQVLASQSVGLTFRLVAGAPRPTIEVIHVAGGRSWMV